MLTLKNNWLELGVDEEDGCIHTLRTSSADGRIEYDYVEKASLTEKFPQCLWGQWELRELVYHSQTIGRKTERR